MQEQTRPFRLAQAAIALAFVAASIAPIRSYDYFWHLATGRWIVEHHALPAMDPFTIASDRVPWVNGEWLFEVPAYLLHTIGGDVSLSLLRAIGVGLLFFMTWRHAWRRQNASDAESPWFAFGVPLLFVALCVSASADRLDLRPSTVAAGFAALAIVLLGRQSSWKRDVLYGILTIAWINIHPSALLAPVIATVAIVLQQFQQRRLVIPQVARLTLISCAALLINPFGWRAVAAPVELTLFVQSGSFVNAEWLPSLPQQFPVLYVVLALSALGLIFSAGPRQLWRLVLFLLFAALAVRSVRNQGMFLIVAPLLIGPVRSPRHAARAGVFAAAVAAGLIAATLISSSHALGLDQVRFPVAAIDGLVSSGLQGNVYNPDQFGGLAIWKLYPPRRVLTDGRNELYRSFVGEYAKARLDGRAWSALLRKYSITLAIDEYHAETMDVVDARTGEHRVMPASLIYFPRSRWALIGFDDAAMVFARRDAYPKSVLDQLEYRVLVPDAVQTFTTEAARQEAQTELARARLAIGERSVIERIGRQLR